MGRLWRWAKRISKKAGSFFTKIGRAVRKAARLVKKIVRLLDRLGITIPASIPTRIIQAIAMIGIDTQLAKGQLQQIAQVLDRLIDRLPKGDAKELARELLARVRSILNNL